MNTARACSQGTLRTLPASHAYWKLSAMSRRGEEISSNARRFSDSPAETLADRVIGVTDRDVSHDSACQRWGGHEFVGE